MFITKLFNKGITIMANTSFAVPHTEDWNNDNHPPFDLQTKATKEEIDRYLKSCPVCWKKECIEYLLQDVKSDTTNFCLYPENDKGDTCQYTESDTIPFDNENKCNDWDLSASALCWKSVCECKSDPTTISILDSNGSFNDDLNENQCEDWGLSACELCWKSECKCNIETNAINATNRNAFNTLNCKSDRPTTVLNLDNTGSLNDDICPVCDGHAFKIDDCYNCLGLD